MSQSIPNLHIVVPVYNEADNLERLFGSFSKLDWELGDRFDLHYLLVDDGSSDGTSNLAEASAGGMDVTVVRHARNTGPGYAFGTAFAHLREKLQPGDWVVTMEGDNTSRHEILAQMLTRTSEGYDVVLASPYMYGGGITQTKPHRVFISHVANVFVKEFLGIHGIVTMSSFYRLYRAEAILEMQQHFGERIVERRGFECMIEMLLKMIWLKFRISEVPMLLDTSRRAGKSKMKVFKTILGYSFLWWRKRRWFRQARSVQQQDRPAVKQALIDPSQQEPRHVSIPNDG